MRIHRIVLDSVLNRLSMDINFHEANLLEAGRGGLHIFYGRNEAGKSTFLTVLLDLLYGGNMDSTVADLYGTNTRLQAWVSHGQQTPLHIVRKKWRNKLVLEDPSVSEEELMHQYLGSYDRERFTLLFGFDHRRLRDGGEGLLRSGGHAGVSLFETGGGIQHLHQVLTELRNRSASLLNPSLRSNATAAIPRALKSYNDAQTALRSESVKPDQWVAKRRDIQRLERELDALETDVTDRQVTQRALERVLRVRGPLSVLQEIQERLAALEPLVVLSVETEDKIVALLNNFVQLGQDIRTVEQEQDRLSKRLDAITRDLDVVRVAEELQLLTEGVRQYEEERQGLPQAAGEVQAIREDAAHLLQRIQPGLSVDHTTMLLVPLAVHQHVQELAARLRSAKEHRDSANTRYQSHLANLREIRRERELLGDMPDLGGLKRLIDEILQAGPLDEDVAELEQFIATKEMELDLILKRQVIWSGPVEVLAALPVPAYEKLQESSIELGEFTQMIRDIDRDLEEASKVRDGIVSHLEVIALIGAAPVEADLDAARAHRDRGWGLVKQSWIYHSVDPVELDAFAGDEELSQVYEKAVETADHQADRMRREAERTTQRAHDMAEQQRIERQLETLQRNRDKCQEQIAAFQSRWQALWEPSGITPGNPEEMQRFVHTVYQPVLQGMVELQTLSSKLSRTNERRHTYRQRLFEMGQVLGLTWPKDVSYATLLGLAQSFLTDQEELAERHRDIEARLQVVQQGIDAEKTALDGGEQNVADIQAEWAAIKAQYGSLPDRLEEAPAHLEAVTDLINRVGEVTRRQARIDRSSQVIEKFESATQALAFKLGSPLDDVAMAASWIRRAQERLQNAMKAEQQHQQLDSLLKDGQEKLQDLQWQRHSLDSAIFEECRQYQCADRDGLAMVVDKSRRYRELRQQCVEQETLLHSVGDGLAVDRLLHEMERWRDEVGMDAIEPRIERLSAEIQEGKEKCDIQREELARERAEFARWDGSDSRAAVHAGEAEGYLALLDQAWNEYLRVELARRLLARAVEEFREKNQSTVLARAAMIFNHLTLGRYRAIEVEYDGDEPYLRLGLDDGATRRVGQLSDGTLDQLFLSLRLAFVDLQMDHGEPLPLIMDDILVHFDDQRTEATFKVLGEMAQRTQILYFTHHDAVVQVASRVARDILSVHDMDEVVRG